MNITIVPSKVFIRKAKLLAKKHRTLISDLKKLEEELKENPDIGIDLGNGLRKVRMSITAKGKGKSGGARVITYTAIASVEDKRITLLTIYDKSEQSTISDQELRRLIAEL
ncbi:MULTISPECIES: type II toxin-antitoxin system RelE/ParE family toxin [Parabacteroides]|uniref:RelE/StbE family addiction module toxin n=1 Tax=Parabacteroides gordonii MS-1 = DSM 23371 TaxID=1203610 RepID=A0A0F5ISK9_9BACT|nr:MULTISPECIES: type II toxin-antitoxin system RelE/ParE family toxin [Parabacteroides]KKB48526.1 hypothetical protein HMPREF1536_04687 [Parabacteroides gordonii MS-1 = DSM 23371]KKB51005.1 hypothetical protein HMPREF1212_01734 [Parabacteroides sp. HGS0025]MCA5585882.1 type II toxin-antitoxin system RelE/ParE family toxin [Parabacteroides gordonii]